MRKNTKNKTVIMYIFFFTLIILIMAIYKIHGNINTYQENESLSKVDVTVETAQNKDNIITEVLENAMMTVVGISKIKNNGITVLGIENANQIGIGSGIIVSEKGYILTNEHVSGGKYSTCYVTLENGEILTGTVIWADEKLDLALVKVNQVFTDYAKLGNSENVKIGQTVYAIGNPIGMEFQRTVTAGIISATNRIIAFEEDGKKIYMDSLIQTDATINPGNSGGPLLNVYGEIIGINTVKITSADGIGFAVPINIIKPIIQKLEAEGKFEEATIGLLAYDINVIKYLDSSIRLENGIYVLESRINNEIKAGDNIIKIENYEIKNINTIREYIYTKQPGEKVKLVLIRDNKEYEVIVTLTKK